MTQTHAELEDAVFWETWWNDQISAGHLHGFMFPELQSPIVRHRGRFYDPANSDVLLIEIMAQYGLSRTVMCAGSGISQEPNALAEAGFDVTALDVSPTAMRVAKALELGPQGVGHFCGPEAHRAGGRVNFVVGNLFDTTVCPGPYDVIIERHTVQRFGENARSVALQALARRLSEVGILLSHCNDPGFFSPNSTSVFHTSESWFPERNWTIWDGAPGSILAGRVGWLIRSAA